MLLSTWPHSKALLFFFSKLTLHLFIILTHQDVATQLPRVGGKPEVLARCLYDTSQHANRHRAESAKNKKIRERQEKQTNVLSNDGANVQVTKKHTKRSQNSTNTAASTHRRRRSEILPYPGILPRNLTQGLYSTRDLHQEIYQELFTLNQDFFRKNFDLPRKFNCHYTLQKCQRRAK